MLRGALVQTAIGLAIGIPTALVCMRYIQAQLYEITSVGPLVVLLATVTLTLAALVAGFIPARRAASIDPAQALRME